MDLFLLHYSSIVLESGSTHTVLEGISIPQELPKLCDVQFESNVVVAFFDEAS